MQIAVPKSRVIQYSFLIYSFFLALSFLFFWPVLHKGFASDDFLVLYRIIYHRVFFIRDFFRPLSDASLYVSYLIGGVNSIFYNAVNIIIHGSCAFLIYRFCSITTIPGITNRPFFAWFAAILFLIYPFHNEAVCWAIGRGIVLSGFFGFLSLLTVFLPVSNLKKHLLLYLFYFIGLCGYETILPLPCIILVLLYAKNKSLKKIWPVAAGYSITLLINIGIRILISGAVLGSYGSSMFLISPFQYLIKPVKAAGRLFLPPSGSSLLLSVCFVVLLLCIAFAGRYITKRKNDQSRGYMIISVVTLFSCVVPLLFGLSTNTYEGDRVFYFSSFFLCIWIAYQVSLIAGNKLRWCTGLLITAYFLFFFYQSVLTWRKSGSMANNIISTIRNAAQQSRKLYLVNIPEEYNGAQVFRNGFMEALLINHIDTAGIKVINYISTASALKIPGTIRPVTHQRQLFIYPKTVISAGEIAAVVPAKNNVSDSVHVKFNTTDKIYYWNKESLVLLKNP